jgi:hypothetical protein
VSAHVTVRAVAAVPPFQTTPAVILQRRGIRASCTCWLGGPGVWRSWGGSAESRTAIDTVLCLWSRRDVAAHLLVIAGFSPRMRATVCLTHSRIAGYCGRGRFRMVEFSSGWREGFFLKYMDYSGTSTLLGQNARGTAGTSVRKELYSRNMGMISKRLGTM